MAVDLWSTQTGRIHDCLTIDCVANGAIVEGSGVIIYGTSTANEITVATSAACGDAVGIALKDASATGDVIPVLFIGVFKCVRSSVPQAIAQGDFVMNSITATLGCTMVTRPKGGFIAANLKVYNGNCYVLGMALHDGTTNGDKFLVLVGKTS